MNDVSAVLNLVTAVVNLAVAILLYKAARRG